MDLTMVLKKRAVAAYQLQKQMEDMLMLLLMKLRVLIVYFRLANYKQIFIVLELKRTEKIVKTILNNLKYSLKILMIIKSIK